MVSRMQAGNVFGFHNGWFSQITGACFHSYRECNERGDDAVPQRKILKRLISIPTFLFSSSFSSRFRGPQAIGPGFDMAKIVN